VAAIPAAGRLTARVALAAAWLATFGAGVAFAGPLQDPVPPPPLPPAPVVAPSVAAPSVPSRHSHAVGLPWRGRLLRGVELPIEGPDHLTWDNVFKRVPNRSWRRWGTDRLVRTVLTVLHEFRLEHPEAPKLLIGDLSREHGGPFGAAFGGLGHFSHQNGRDVDIYYPRIDRRLREPTRVAQIDHGLAADLVRRFIEAGAVKIFVGPHTGLTGPKRIVQKLVHHDNHFHVRIGPVAP
jgi:murein endopeptidase